MSKYIKLEDMENLIINIAPDGDVFTREMLALQSLPTIEVSEDCVSRADWLHEAIRCEVLCTNHMKSDMGCDGGCQYDTDLLKRIDKVIDKVIVDTPTERTGKWIAADDESIMFTVYKCSRCGNILGSSPHNYCPNCGARMESDAE